MKTGNACLMASLENPNLNGVSLGLNPDDGFSLKQSLFPCCQGSGFFQSPVPAQAISHGQGSQKKSPSYEVEWFLQQNLPKLKLPRKNKTAAVGGGRTHKKAPSQQTMVTRQCKIKSRHSQVQRLVRRFHQLWEGEKMPLPDGEVGQRVIVQAAAAIKGEGPQGYLWPTTQFRPSPEIWGTALALVWRFGCQVHVVSFAHKGRTLELPDQAALQGSQPIVFICEQLRRITDDFDRSQLEAVISLAYQTNGYLWLEVVNERPATRGESLAMRKARERVNRIKRKPPLAFLREHLSAASYSQLKSLLQLPRIDHALLESLANDAYDDFEEDDLHIDTYH